MKTLFLEKSENDSYINLYESGIFIKASEYSALLLTNLFSYKLLVNIDKKTGYIYLEVGFPTNKKEEIFQRLHSFGYSIRFIKKENNQEIINGTKDLKKDKKELLKQKNLLIKLE